MPIKFFLVAFNIITFGFAQIPDTLTDTVFCGNTRIIFNTRCEAELEGILLIHVHENETTAMQVANGLLDSVKQGCFVTWQCMQQRYVTFSINRQLYRFDPNRIFSKAGITATLGTIKKPSAAAVQALQQVADQFKKRYIENKRLIIALHNNTDDGGLSVASYQKGATYGRDASQVYINPDQDADDFLYTTDSQAFLFYKNLGFNVVLQDNDQVTDDGSLSVLCSRLGIPYVNIEAQEGHLLQQQQMLLAVWKWIEENFQQPSD